MTLELTESTLAPFAAVCTLTETAAPADGVGRYAGVIDDVWTIGTKVHGGTMVAASAAAAARLLRATDPALAEMAPIAASSDFLGAPDPGAVDYEVRVRKIGRQICLVDTTLVQDGRDRVRTAFTFGHLDDGEPLYAPEHTDMPAEPPADALGYQGSPMGDIVHVAQGAELFLDKSWARFLDGAQGEPRLRLWMRPLAGDQADPEVSALFAMMAADMSPPVSMNLGHFGWAPTVQMTTYLRRRPAPGWLRIVAVSHEVGGRLFDEDQLVLDSTGAIVAQSRQLALLPQRR
ncbi:thioesterase family protein [Nocardia puris]|uniref:Acyl-CoA thioesterase n=1 Tax=Nocardia puris TaxID=208602 RepID=A0A366DNC6_9NOCA|nr:thioesterase family protein [Nocardia puris]MBF6211371.1 thioesterase family protein [Nocardia puris]MBF6365089.1 thioesterase family protein [Nocardia puris]MBF6458874.1 thioesterase family protein [Nocardia puris]RBO90728.1 acyl-CoA thioesterase [Nocardia puris]